ncbi:MAG TPA: hypothetical protein VIL07_09690 [Symbiobacteriaceae bacterium]
MSNGGSAPPKRWQRALRVGLLSFVLAVVVNYVSDLALSSVHVLVAFIVVLVLVTINVALDILGTSVTAADQVPLNAKASKRIPGARQAIWLVRNADRVANFCNDVVGDVTGAVSGAAGTTVALQLAEFVQGGPAVSQIFMLLIVGLIAGLTVGGKAAGKNLAIERATDVVMVAGRLLYAFERVTGRSFTGGRGKAGRRRKK